MFLYLNGKYLYRLKRGAFIRIRIGIFIQIRIGDFIKRRFNLYMQNDDFLSGKGGFKLG